MELQGRIHAFSKYLSQCLGAHNFATERQRVIQRFPKEDLTKSLSRRKNVISGLILGRDPVPAKIHFGIQLLDA
jgi:hypothetical protein